MYKKVVVSGLLGFVVLIAWGFIVNGVLGFNSRINMKQISDESLVYEVLKESIIEPGRYTLNPELTPAGMFPDGEPVYSIHYSGIGHESAGKVMLFQFTFLLLASMISVWMLSQTAPHILSSYRRKVLYFVTIGLLVAVFGELMNFGIDKYSLNDVLLLAANDILAWTLVGLVVAKSFSPEPSLITVS
jgi:hypothetical protein